MNIGNVLQLQGDYEHALLRYQKALGIQEVALGPSHVTAAAAARQGGGPPGPRLIIL